ncbi:salicylate carboxymethyltransferase-like [Coffea eugenioides]|uniref:salicylate carboxymethyltransferase-like n=1 Tax=Coffea eugenioides TaxID=49369 RepID=UPI000F61494D|nr:salicylate carboxymethyltransferase-like [Coffea eugenioides]
MEVIEVLHMNGGNGDESYANNSLVPQKVILMTRPITEAAISDLYCSLIPKSICIADLGCSSGPNTFLAVSGLLKTVDKKRKILGHKSPEYQIYLNDLPSNDFNTIFKSVPRFQEKLKMQMESGFGPCLFAGVPGSFYQRLFPTKTVHFVHSSYSLQWLSQVPELKEINKGNIYMASSSPSSVIRAYVKQFEKDFSTFLSCRAEELVTGGRMVLTILGRKSEDPCSKDGCYIWELLALALNGLVSEGLIEEEKLDSFNIPHYNPSPAEVRNLVEMEGSFMVDHLEATEIHWNAYDSDSLEFDKFKDGGYYVAKCMRAVAEPLLVSHFGEGIIEEVFPRYRKILSDRMSKEKTQFISVIVSLAKRA